MEYIVILQSCWMNKSGSGIGYDWDGERFATRQLATLHGFEVRDSDDFNIGVVEGERLVDFCWMEESLCEDAETMAEIARSCNLEYTEDAARAQRAAAQGDGHE